LVCCLFPSTSLDILLFSFFEIGHVHQTLYRQWSLWYACQMMESKIRILGTWQLRFIIWLFFRNQSEKVGLLIKTLIKEFPLCWTSFYIYFYNYLDLYRLELVWNLFKIYDSDAFYFILWLNIYFLNNFVNTRGYSWISADMKKIDEYPHNGYPTDIGTGTGQIFIQRVGYRGATTCTLPDPLTSLHSTLVFHRSALGSLTTFCIWSTEHDFKGA